MSAEIEYGGFRHRTLQLLADRPASESEICAHLGLSGRRQANQQWWRMRSLIEARLVIHFDGRYRLTPRGQRALGSVNNPRPSVRIFQGLPA